MKHATWLWTAAALSLAGCVSPDPMAQQRALQEAVDQCHAHKKLYMNSGMKLDGPDIVVSGYCLPPAARESLEMEASKLGAPIKTELPSYTLVASSDQSVFYYFTKPSHRAYPWAMKLAIAHAPAAVAKSAQPANVIWMAGIPAGADVPADVQTTNIVVAWMLKVLNATKVMAAHPVAATMPS